MMDIIFCIIACYCIYLCWPVRKDIKVGDVYIGKQTGTSVIILDYAHNLVTYKYADMDCAFQVHDNIFLKVFTKC